MLYYAILFGKRYKHTQLQKTSKNWRTHQNHTGVGAPAKIVQGSS